MLKLVLHVSSVQRSTQREPRDGAGCSQSYQPLRGAAADPGVLRPCWVFLWRRCVIYSEQNHNTALKMPDNEEQAATCSWALASNVFSPRLCRNCRRVHQQRHVDGCCWLWSRVVEPHSRAQVLQETGQASCQEAGCYLRWADNKQITSHILLCI